MDADSNKIVPHSCRFFGNTANSIGALNLLSCVTFSTHLLDNDGYGSAANRWWLRRVLALALCIMSGLMSLVVVEQARTIDSQRVLIHQLFQDSLALNAAKMKLAQSKR